jgi:hypothetical protein
MRTFENFRKVVNESDYILSEAQRYLEILLEKDSEALKQYKKSQKSFQKGFGKNIKPTVVQPGLDLYKAGGPFVPDKTTFKNTGKKVPSMEPKPQFGKPKTTSKAPDRTGLKKSIADVRASEKRLYDAGVGKKPSLVQQRKLTIAKIKELSRQTTRGDAFSRATGTSGSTEGSAGASGSSKTKVVKQSEVSKKAKDFTKDVNQKRVSSSGYSQTNKPKPGSEPTLFKRVKPKTSVTPSEVVDQTPFDDKSGTVKKKKITKNLTRKNRGFTEPIKKITKKTTKVKLPDVGKKVTTAEYRRTVSKKYGIKPENILSKTQKSALKTKRLVQKDVVKAAIGPQNRAFFKKAISLPGAKKAAPVIKALAKAGPVGRVAATVGAVAALSPAARKGMSSFAKRALTGAGLGGIVGGAAASQKETDKERIKKNLKPEFVKDKDGKEIKTVTRMGLNLSDISKPKKKDKGRTAQSIATEVDYLKKRQKVAPYGSKYTG